MRLMMITQKIDESDPVMAFMLGWVRGLAARLDHLHVLCLEQHAENLSVPLPPNVTLWSMGKERGYGRIREFIAFQRAMARTVADIDAVFVHMIPRYVWLGAPYTIAYRKPQILWYAHRQINLELRLALAASKVVVTSVPSAFPLPTGKLRVVGQGIDADYFSTAARCVPDDPPLIVYVARLMPIKHQDVLLRAVAAIPDVRLALVGAVPSGQDAAYQTQLQELAQTLGIANRVIFTGGLVGDAVRDMLRRATLGVNLSPPGLFDKAALESMLVGLPTLVCNPAFDPLLGDHVPQLRFSKSEDVEGLTSKLRALLALPRTTLASIGSNVREHVKAVNSLDGLMDRLVAVFVDAAGQP